MLFHFSCPSCQIIILQLQKSSCFNKFLSNPVLVKGSKFQFNFNVGGLKLKSPYNLFFTPQVSMIEPGNFLAATKLFNQSIIGKQADAMWDKMPEEVKNAYGESYFRNKVGSMDKYFHIGFKTVTPVIESYTNALLDVFPQVRYQPMGLFWKVRTFVYTHLPESIFDWIYM